jgi:quinolinate synthase
MVDAAVLERTTPVYERVRQFVPPFEWPVFAEDIGPIIAGRARQAVERMPAL